MTYMVHPLHLVLLILHFMQILFNGLYQQLDKWLLCPKMSHNIPLYLYVFHVFCVKVPTQTRTHSSCWATHAVSRAPGQIIHYMTRVI